MAQDMPTASDIPAGLIPNAIMAKVGAEGHVGGRMPPPITVEAELNIHKFVCLRFEVAVKISHENHLDSHMGSSSLVLFSGTAYSTAFRDGYPHYAVVASTVPFSVLSNSEDVLENDVLIDKITTINVFIIRNFFFFCYNFFFNIFKIDKMVHLNFFKIFFCLFKFYIVSLMCYFLYTTKNLLR